jgi:hypothetical protein
MWGTLSDERTGLYITFVAGLARAVFLRSEFLGTHNHILRSQIWDSLNLDGQVSISPRNRVAQLHLQALGLKLKSRYDWWSVSTSWCRAHCGTCDQTLILSEFCCFVSVRRLLWREVGCLLSVTVSSNYLLQVFSTKILYESPPRIPKGGCQWEIRTLQKEL